MQVLRDTMRTTQSIATAMAAVADYWDRKHDAVTDAYGCRNYAEHIQSLFPALSDILTCTRGYLYDHWPDIARNPMLENETGKYINSLRAFFGQLRSFEDKFCGHSREAFELFQDVWIARKYFVLMLEQQKEYETLFARFDELGKERPSYSRPFRGIARAFRKYMPGVSDNDLENLIVHNWPVPGERFWGGSRQEAVIFGKFFGIPAAAMNHSFLFGTKDFGCRDINYTQDASRMKNPVYPIIELLEQFKHCKA